MGNRFQIPFYYGTWAGLAAFAYFLLVWATPFSPLGFARFGGAWIPVLFIFWAIIKQREALAEEGITLGRAFMTGMYVALVLSFLKAVLVYMILEYVDPGIITQANNESIRMLEWSKTYNPDPSAVEEQIAVVKDAAEKSSPFSTAAAEINLYFMGGIPVSLLAALILKRKPKNG